MLNIDQSQAVYAEALVGVLEGKSCVCFVLSQERCYRRVRIPHLVASVMFERGQFVRTYSYQNDWFPVGSPFKPSPKGYRAS